MRLRWLAVGALIASGAAQAQRVAVPFVGCAADGQVGPRAAPRSGRAPRLQRAAAAGLAYYASTELGVLAPRGWHCFETYGSNGATLIVTPGRRGYRGVRDGRIRGPAVALSFHYGGTSGRFAVAEMIARYFPARRSFIREIRDMGLEIDPLAEGPYAGDRTERLTDREVEVATPPQASGLGTNWELAPDPLPTQTLVRLFPEDEMNMVSVRVRLPARQRGLARPIFASVRAPGGRSCSRC